ncbi:MAG: hypothetical protein R3C56_24470 [Pirellulaceae bacterium]
MTEIRLLTNNPKKTEAFNLRGFDLQRSGGSSPDRVPFQPPQRGLPPCRSAKS